MSWFPKQSLSNGCLWWTVISACVLTPIRSVLVPPGKQYTCWTPSDPVVFANRSLITLISALFKAMKPKPLSAMLHLESRMHFFVIVICVLLEVNDEMLTCATWLVAVGSSRVLSGCRFLWCFALQPWAACNQLCTSISIISQLFRKPSWRLAKENVSWSQCDKQASTNAISAADRRRSLWSWFALMVELNSAWDWKGRGERVKESTLIFLQVSHLVEV